MAHGAYAVQEGVAAQVGARGSVRMTGRCRYTQIPVLVVPLLSPFPYPLSPSYVICWVKRARRRARRGGAGDTPRSRPPRLPASSQRSVARERTRRDVRAWSTATCRAGSAPHRSHAILAAAGPHNPGFLPGILPGSPGYALYPSAQVPVRVPGGTRTNDALETETTGGCGCDCQ